MVKTVEHRERDVDRLLLRAYHQGLDARTEGLPCTPPEGYGAIGSLDLAGVWAAGWEEAERELAAEASAQSASR